MNQKISIIIPCKNEEDFIYNVLENIFDQDYGIENIEVIIGDGMSTDGTIDEINRFKSAHEKLKVQVVENPKQTVPYALNKAIKMSSAEFIVRMDAHSVYPKNYISRLVKELEARPKAWNVGGVCLTQSKNELPKEEAIAMATSHPIGVGNSYFRISTSEIKEVDTVPFGCFRREVFDKIGFFDEDLSRNQDDEFNGRIIKNGGKIYLIPEVEITYYARSSFKKLAKMFFQYGYFKPLVNKKLGSPATLRQFAPLVLVLGIIFGWIPALIFSPWIWVYTGGVAFYILLLMLVSFKLSPPRLFLTFSAFLIIHFSYGWGYIRGIIDFLILKKSKKTKEIEISR